MVRMVLNTRRRKTMKKAAIQFSIGLGIALAGLGIGLGSASGQSIQDMQQQMMQQQMQQMQQQMTQQMPQQMMPQQMPNVQQNMAGSMASSIAGAMASGMASSISPAVTANVGMDTLFSPEVEQKVLSSSTPVLDIRQMIDQAISGMPQNQRNELAQQMTNQNLALLQQGSAAATRIRNQVRDTIMMDRYRHISSMAPNSFRSRIQPQMVQTIIGSIRPWELPNRFKSQMMPMIVGEVSNQIKMPQIQYMQAGIGDSSFPPVPGLPMSQSMGGQIKDQQMKFMQEGVMNDPNFIDPNRIMNMMNSGF
jgi:hypothetical protein